MSIISGITSSPWQMATQFAGKLPGLMKWGIVNKAIGFLGHTPTWDLRKNYSPDEEFRNKHKKELSGVGYYIRRYGITWGNILGLVGIVTAFITGRKLKSNPETPSVKLT